MGEHAKIRNIPDLLLWAAYEDIDEGLFKEASQTILSIVRAFKYESKLESSLSICLNGLSYDDYIVFVKELVKEIELIQKIVDHFDRPEQCKRVSRFTVFVLSSLRGMAESLLRLKKGKDAITVLKEARNLKPNDSDILALLGRAYFEYLNLGKSKTISQTDKVIKGRVRAIERESSSTGADISAEVKEESVDEFASRKLEEAEELRAQGKPSEAIECLDAVLIVKPDDEEVLIEVGTLYLFLEAFDKALNIFEELYEISPEDSLILNFLGDSYKHLEQYEKAENILKRAYEINPTESVILYNLGDVYFELQQYKEARYFLEKSNDLSPNEPLTLLSLSGVYIKLKLVKEAIETLKHANKLNPDNSSTIYALGTMYLFNSQYEESIMMLEKLSKFNKPDNPKILMKLGICYINIKQYQEAKYALEKAHALEPDNLIVLIYLGFLCLMMGQYQEAKSNLEEAKELKSDEPSILVNLGKAYYNLGDISNSKKSMESAYEFDKNNPEIKRNLEIVLGEHEGELSCLYPSINSHWLKMVNDFSLN